MWYKTGDGNGYSLEIRLPSLIYLSTFLTFLLEGRGKLVEDMPLKQVMPPSQSMVAGQHGLLAK